MANAFETAERKAIPAVLIYARRGEEVLMLHRAARGDVHDGKWNGLGGKCEPGESPWQTASREFFEEAGVRIEESRFKSLGVLQFPNFKPKKSEDWLVYVFSVELNDDEKGGLKSENPEGRLEFVPDDELLSLNLWEGDRHFLPHMMSGSPFMGTFWYENGRLSDYQLEVLQ